MDTLGEWSDGDDQWIMDVDVPGERNDREAAASIRDIPEQMMMPAEWEDPEADAIIRNIPEQMLLDAWNDYVTDGSIRDIPEQMMPAEWEDPEADAIIRNIPEQMLLDAWNDYVTDGSIRDIPEQMMPAEWEDPEADAIIRDIPEQMLLDAWNDYVTDGSIRDIPEQMMPTEQDGPEVDGSISDIPEQMILDARDDPEVGGSIPDIPGQMGEGKKRKHDDTDDDDDEEEGQDFYHIVSVKKYTSKKFRATAVDTAIRFNNVLNDMDLIENHKSTYRIFERLLSDVTKGMNEKDYVRFVLRSTQLETPISIPFLSLDRLTPERVLSAVQHVIQSNRDFRLNDMVNVDLIHVEAPQGSGRSKRNITNIKEYLHKKRSIITITNEDNLCLARALVVAIAKAANAPNYNYLLRSVRAQQVKAIELHTKAKVPMSPSCGLEEVDMFQKHLTEYEINIVSANHDNTIIYPSQSSTNKTPIYLFLHDRHYDVITSMPSFLSKAYYCHKCKRSYSNKLDHLCPGMCKSCRSYECYINDPMHCDECKRTFKSRACYERHKEPVGTARSVCDTIRKCEKCQKSMDVRKLNQHICGRKCSTCGIILEDAEAKHECYIQKIEQSEEEDSQYNELLFFDFECKQETGEHDPNLCIVHNEAGRQKLFNGKDTTEKFCNWLFSKEHQDCIVVAHNFQGYDGYFIQNFLIKNAIYYKIIYHGAKILSMTVPMFNIKFIDSLNFMPMALAALPKTFGVPELCKGYFPHLFNKEENQNYVGPIPPVHYYHPNGMKPKVREEFLTWHKEKVESNYVFNFKEEIEKYCRSDVDILRNCCMKFREMLREISGIDPFEKCITIASVCHEVYRTNYLEKDTIAVFNNNRQLKTKQSNIAVKWLSWLAEKNEIDIEHVRNGGEKRIGKYSLDGYCEERNTVYEFQGCYWHGKDVIYVTLV